MRSRRMYQRDMKKMLQVLDRESMGKEVKGDCF